jgi:hypothetical protein
MRSFRGTHKRRKFGRNQASAPMIFEKERKKSKLKKAEI